jgi:anti-sigma B factor antagonist
MFRQHAVHSPESDLLCAPHEIVTRSQRAEDVHVVQLMGELDKDSAPAFEAELKRVEATDARQIVVDLSGLTFIGSDGLKVFIHANARLRGTNRLLLVRGNDEVQSTFEVSGLVSRLPFDDHGGPQREPPASARVESVGTHIVVSRPVHAWPRGGR